MDHNFLLPIVRGNYCGAPEFVRKPSVTFYLHEEWKTSKIQQEFRSHPYNNSTLSSICFNRE